MSDEAITVTYASRRDEVARFYWASWKRQLWVFHLIVLVAIIVMGTALRWPIIMTIGAGAGAIGFFFLFPQLAFKPQTRTLTIDADGLRTKIGKKVGERAWREIAKIEESGGNIVMRVRASGNAFIVPPRAFAGEDERNAFLRAAQEWMSKPTDGQA